MLLIVTDGEPDDFLAIWLCLQCHRGRSVDIVVSGADPKLIRDLVATYRALARRAWRVLKMGAAVDVAHGTDVLVLAPPGALTTVLNRASVQRLGRVVVMAGYGAVDARGVAPLTYNWSRQPEWTSHFLHAIEGRARSVRFVSTAAYLAVGNINRDTCPALQRRLFVAETVDTRTRMLRRLVATWDKAVVLRFPHILERIGAANVGLQMCSADVVCAALLLRPGAVQFTQRRVAYTVDHVGRTVRVDHPKADVERDTGFREVCHISGALEAVAAILSE